MSFAINGAIESGLIFAIMALGVFITFRILKFPDLTVDGSFTTGGALAAAMVTAGHSPVSSIVVALLAGTLAGSITGLLHTKGKIDPLLSGILMMIALYSINLRIMGKANIGLLGQSTLFSIVDVLVSMIPLVFILIVLVNWFFKTEIGLAIRATGDNERMIRSFSVNTDTTKIIGLAMSNGMVALAGALMAQYQGFADVSMGIGMIVIGLASVIIGEFIFGGSSIARATIAVVGGTIIYRLIIAFALKLNLNPMDLKLMTALIVIAALVAPRFMKGRKPNKKGVWRKVAASSGGESNAEA